MKHHHGQPARPGKRSEEWGQPVPSAKHKRRSLRQWARVGVWMRRLPKATSWDTITFGQKDQSI
jgi:hypothetical protein